MITNFKNLATNPLREKALLIVEAGYEAIDIEKIISERIKIKNDFLDIKLPTSPLKLDIKKFKRIFLIGIGKGSALACATLAKILGNKLTSGIALDIQKPSFKLQVSGFSFLTGTHPLPSIQNIKATQEIIKLAKNLQKDDLLITFICGGGSALLCGSQNELNASRTIFKELTQKGADIIELNTIRKHLSEIKGGNLAKLAYPTAMISLIVSDVLGNDLSMVSSGPTVYDETIAENAIHIFNKFKIPYSKFQLTETPKDKKYFQNVKNVLFLSNREPILAMEEKAKELGFKPKIYSLELAGEAEKAILPLIKTAQRNSAVLAAGETTVTLKSQKMGKPFDAAQGKGGRNMEAVLGVISNFSRFARSDVARQFPISNSLTVLSLASDGRDNTESAGAIADFSTIEKIEKLKLDPQKFLKNHDSFGFFQKTEDLIFTEPKTFNVSDLMLVLSSSKE